MLANSGETFAQSFQGCQSRDGGDKTMSERNIKGTSITNWQAQLSTQGTKTGDWVFS